MSNRHEQSIGVLYESSRLDVFRYLRALGLNPDAAQDLAQEAFVRLVAAMRGGQRIEQPRAWVFRVAHNLAMDHRQQQSRVSQDPTQLALLRDGSMDAERELIRQEKMDGFQQAVGRLSAQQRQVLELRAAGLKHREIAELLGIQISTVGEFLRRAIAGLKKQGV